MCEENECLSVNLMYDLMVNAASIDVNIHIVMLIDVVEIFEVKL